MEQLTFHTLSKIKEFTVFPAVLWCNINSKSDSLPWKFSVQAIQLDSSMIGQVMLSAASCCSSQISESAKAAKRKHAVILPSPTFIPSPCQEEWNKIDVGRRELLRKFLWFLEEKPLLIVEKKKKTTNILVAFPEIKTCLLRELSWLCVRWAGQSRVVAISTVATGCLDLPLLWNALRMDVAMGALPMLWSDIRQPCPQMRLGFINLHKSSRAEDTKHVIPSPSRGSRQGVREVEGGCVPPGLLWSCWPSGPRARLEKISADLRVGGRSWAGASTAA